MGKGQNSETWGRGFSLSGERGSRDRHRKGETPVNRSKSINASRISYRWIEEGREWECNPCYATIMERKRQHRKSTLLLVWTTTRDQGEDARDCVLPKSPIDFIPLKSVKEVLRKGGARQKRRDESSRRIDGRVRRIADSTQSSPENTR